MSTKSTHGFLLFFLFAGIFSFFFPLPCQNISPPVFAMKIYAFYSFHKANKKAPFLKRSFCLRNAGTTEEGYRYIQNLPASSDKTITFPKTFPIIYLWTDNYSLSLYAYHIIRNKYNQISAAKNLSRNGRDSCTRFRINILRTADIFCRSPAHALWHSL